MSRLFRALLRFVIILVIISSLLLIVFRTKFHGTIRSLAETKVKNSTSDLINDAIDRQIDVGNIQYDRIVYFEKDLDGKITALKTNMSEVNRLKTSILNIINDEILAMDTTDLGIPVGSLILPEFWSGRGPHIPVQILSISNSEASFESYFTEAGINQTLQKLIMNISVDVSILVLGRTESFTVTSQVVVAETIIVGEVPDTLLQAGGSYGSKTEN
ncbi:MAG: sporulation protein YunB [Ruminococcaceae bacterium]|nr:sporulation protein YunB [Oscillospiraceae bacterium]